MQGVCWFLSQTGEEGTRYALIQPWVSAKRSRPRDRDRRELSTTGPQAGKVKVRKASCL